MNQRKGVGRYIARLANGLDRKQTAVSQRVETLNQLFTSKAERALQVILCIRFYISGATYRPCSRLASCASGENELLPTRRAESQLPVDYRLPVWFQ